MPLLSAGKDELHGHPDRDWSASCHIKVGRYVERQRPVGAEVAQRSFAASACAVQRPFEGWTLDVVHDRLFNGRAFRVLTMMDDSAAAAFALELNYSFPSRVVIDGPFGRSCAPRQRHRTSTPTRLFQNPSRTEILADSDRESGA